ncbi:hypothetical protein U9M48_031524 [Paspalum notatum var. saurae]|uniref:Uncharacterized protein n=1 Tax=Paspalum notatum var. saurae TaxID=547442 RepID=A0AAQ3U308_PASNO
MHDLIHKCAWLTLSICIKVVLTTMHMSFSMKYIYCMLSSACHLHQMHTSAFVCTYVCTFHAYRPRDRRRDGAVTTSDRRTRRRAEGTTADR